MPAPDDLLFANQQLLDAVAGRGVDFDLRTLRYWTSIGVLDSPAGADGRKALYNQRHVDQIVAVRKLQESGVSLSGAKLRLAHLDDAALAAVAAGTSAASSTTRAAGAFWATGPADDVDPFDLTDMDRTAALAMWDSGSPVEAGDLRSVLTFGPVAITLPAGLEASAAVRAELENATAGVLATLHQLTVTSPAATEIRD